MFEQIMVFKKKKTSETWDARFLRLNRIIPNAGIGNRYTTIWEIEVYSGEVNLALQPGVIATASSNYTGQPPQGAIDGVWDNISQSHRWSSASQSYPWFKIDFGTIVTFNDICISCGITHDQMIRDFDLEISNDDVVYNKIYEVRNLVHPTPGPYKPITIFQ